ncbi:hypothetical protein ABN034_06990 [Actinopolymorpha sp. B11F2]|uniref:hypothetical protein n=1 Tax=Actinopolymorpha sp. B11F2 TaxID=3160862 RepID=UPI0032E3CE2F
MRLKVLSAIVGALGLILALPASAGASHSWGNYHWARTQNPFTLALGDNVSSAWDSYLSTASSDWSKSSVLDTRVVAGGARSKNCRPTSGRGEVCNAAYGNNGWLGVAQIWVSGNHITQGTVKLNDTYFNTSTYNTPAWRNLVMCQEVGHVFGLDHQDENFDNPNLGTCMDYTSDPASNQHPNAHDYAQLETIYAHLDSTTTVGSSTAGHGRSGLHSRAEWGQALHRTADGSESLYARDLGQGEKVFTFVFWTP